MSTTTVLRTTDAPPEVLQLSVVCWVGAVSAGGVESVLHAAAAFTSSSESVFSVLAQLLIRATLYAGVLAVVAQLWQGRDWARWTLAVLLGGVGTASLLAGPVLWLADGHRLGELQPDAAFLTFALVRLLHLSAVWAALVLMFQPAATAYLRRRS
jgi:hypothetical protein